MIQAPCSKDTHQTPSPHGANPAVLTLRSNLNADRRGLFNSLFYIMYIIGIRISRRRPNLRDCAWWPTEIRTFQKMRSSAPCGAFLGRWSQECTLRFVPFAFRRPWVPEEKWFCWAGS